MFQTKLSSVEDLKLNEQFSKLLTTKEDTTFTLEQIFAGVSISSSDKNHKFILFGEEHVTESVDHSRRPLYCYPSTTESEDGLLSACGLDRVALSQRIPERFLDFLLPQLLPLPKYTPPKVERKFPLSLDDPSIKKLPLYQKYSWLDVVSSSDDEAEKKQPQSEEVNSQGLSELRKFRKGDVETDCNPTSHNKVHSQTAPATDKPDEPKALEAKKIKNKDPLYQINSQTLTKVSEFYNNMADLDILGLDNYMTDSLGVVNNSSDDSTSFSFKRLVPSHCSKNINSSFYSSLETISFNSRHNVLLKESLEDANSSLGYQSSLLSRKELTAELCFRNLRKVQKTLEEVVTTNSSEVYILKELVKSDDSNKSFCLANHNNSTEYSKNYNLSNRLHSAIPLYKSLCPASTQSDMYSHYRALARQDSINTAVNLLKRKRRMAKRGGLLSTVGLYQLGQTDLNRMSNALSEPLN